MAKPSAPLSPRPRRSKLASTPPKNAGFLTTAIHFYKFKIRPHITKKRLIIASLLFVAFLLLLPLITYAYFARDISDKDRLMNRNNTGIVLKDRNGTPFYSSGVLSTEDDVPLSEIDDSLEKAVIASEDQTFYTNNGFSPRGIMGALYGNITNRSATAAGGSTLTQQLVKNKLLSSSKNYIRKYQEVSMAIAVDRKYTKKEILEMYLNSVYFGDGAFGISDAAKTYFDKKPSDLTLAESSMLVGLLPAPSVYSPVTGDEAKSKQAQKNVLRKMVETKAITTEERDEALNTELTYATGAEKGGSEYAQHFADMILKDLDKKYGEERVKRSGFEVTTTLDLGKQQTAEKIIKDQVALTQSRGGRNAGLVAIDPKTGEVQALVGSVDYFNKEFGQVNMATSLRQPGSSFKPIYYSAAIEKGLITAGTILNDKQTTYGGTYSPKNYDNRYKGPMSARSALAESRNIPAVEVMQKVGVTNAATAAKRMGITTVTEPQKYGLSLALGTAEVQLIQMTSAYTAFANEGKRYTPIMYTKIADKYGKTIDTAKKQKPSDVMSSSTAFIMSSILSDTSARAPTYGSSLNVSGKNVALKTGTTNDSRDAWTIGFTPSIAVGVWLGNNENLPMTGGLAGGSGAGAIWRKTMTSYLSKIKSEKFVQPSDVKAISICVGTELRSEGSSGEGTRTEYFKSGTEPKGVCNSKSETKSDEKSNKEEEDAKKLEEDQKKQQENSDNTGPGTTPGDTDLPEEELPPIEEPTDPGDTGPGNGGGRGSDDEPTDPTTPTP